MFRFVLRGHIVVVELHNLVVVTLDHIVVIVVHKEMQHVLIEALS